MVGRTQFRLDGHGLCQCCSCNIDVAESCSCTDAMRSPGIETNRMMLGPELRSLCYCAPVMLANHQRGDSRERRECGMMGPCLLCQQLLMVPGLFTVDIQMPWFHCLCTRLSGNG